MKDPTPPQSQYRPQQQQEGEQKYQRHPHHNNGNGSVHRSVGSSLHQGRPPNRDSRNNDRSHSRSRSREFYGSDHSVGRGGGRPPSNGAQEQEKDSYYGRMPADNARHGSPPRGDRHSTGSRGRGGNAQDSYYGPGKQDGDSYYSDRRTSDKRDPSRGRSRSVDDESSLVSHGSPQQSPPPPVAEEWPPSFEKEGSAFVFDTRSAMFYESLSDFFYDPKSKLYYGNRKGTYFRYDDSNDPPFVEVQKMADPSLSSSEGQNASHNTMEQVPLQPSKPHGSEASKPKIAINLKTKRLKAVKKVIVPVIGTSEVSTTTKSQKEKIADIEKWTEKQAELKQDSIGDAGVTASKSTENVRLTVKGEPICVVCRKKFPTIDKLRLHERASDLHKQNLQKLKEKQATAGKRKTPGETSTEASLVYQDRAEKRRQLHGPCTVEMLQQQRPVADDLHHHYGPPAKGEALDESHVGHKLLQKLGWKGHSGSSSEQMTTTLNGRIKSAAGGASDQQLRKDWDRIESLAGNHAPHSRR